MKLSWVFPGLKNEMQQREQPLSVLALLAEKWVELNVSQASSSSSKGSSEKDRRWPFPKAAWLTSCLFISTNTSPQLLSCSHKQWLLRKTVFKSLKRIELRGCCKSQTVTCHFGPVSVWHLHDSNFTTLGKRSPGDFLAGLGWSPGCTNWYRWYLNDQHTER